jgi:glycosyltransferase involved in cell wall biosynthesis
MNKIDFKILWLRERFKWMGQHSGYDQVVESIAKVQPGEHISIFKRTEKKPFKGTKRILAWLAREAYTSPYYTVNSTSVEVFALLKCLIYKIYLVHLTYVENDLGILSDFKDLLSLKLIGTAHQPVSWWQLMHPNPNAISNLDALIVLSSKELRYFEQFLPDRVYFVPHGVDIGFFQPNPEITEKKYYPRCIFSGKWLRDIDTLAKVIDEVIFQNPGIRFDMIVPRTSRNDPLFFRIARHEQVTWHTDLSDEQLLKVNQQANMLVLPLLDCTANNALLEAISCGVPVISNKVGGMSDYTRDTFANLSPVGDVDSMVTAILELADSPQQQIVQGKAARAFAEEQLDWNDIALRTLDIYSKVMHV